MYFRFKNYEQHEATIMKFREISSKMIQAKVIPLCLKKIQSIWNVLKFKLLSVLRTILNSENILSQHKKRTYSAIFLRFSVIRWRSRLLVSISSRWICVLPRCRASRSQIRPRRRWPWSLLRQVGLVIRARQQFPMWRGTSRALLLLVARLLLMLLLAAGCRPVRCGRSWAIAGNASRWCVQLRRL